MYLRFILYINLCLDLKKRASSFLNDHLEVDLHSYYASKTSSIRLAVSFPLGTCPTSHGNTMPTSYKASRVCWVWHVAEKHKVTFTAFVRTLDHR